MLNGSFLARSSPIRANSINSRHSQSLISRCNGTSKSLGCCAICETRTKTLMFSRWSRGCTHAVHESRLQTRTLIAHGIILPVLALMPGPGVGHGFLAPEVEQRSLAVYEEVADVATI